MHIYAFKKCIQYTKNNDRIFWRHPHKGIPIPNQHQVAREGIVALFVVKSRFRLYIHKVLVIWYIMVFILILFVMAGTAAVKMVTASMSPVVLSAEVTTYLKQTQMYSSTCNGNVNEGFSQVRRQLLIDMFMRLNVIVIF